MTKPSLSLLSQELVAKVVHYFHDDIPTLKSCSLASPRIFYQPTRQYLFKKITLDRQDSAVALDQALSKNPKLPTHIRLLEVSSYEEKTLQAIVTILPLLSQTRHLVLGTKQSTEDFHGALDIGKKALDLLIPILQLPQLDMLTIISAKGFPPSHFHIPQGIRSLSLIRTILATEYVGQKTFHPLNHLESISLESVISTVGSSNPIVDAPNLSQVIIQDSRTAAWNILTAARNSIQTVIWRKPMLEETTFSNFQNLRRVCFSPCRGNWDPTGYNIWMDISLMLHAKKNSQSVEEVSIAIPSWVVDFRELPRVSTGAAATKFKNISFTTRDGVILQGYSHVSLPGFINDCNDIWKDFPDKGKFPRLKKVSIHVFEEKKPAPLVNRGGSWQSSSGWEEAHEWAEPEFEDSGYDGYHGRCTPSAEMFHAALAIRFPLLSEKGMLETSVDEKFDWRQFL